MSRLLLEPKMVFVFSSFLKVRVTTAPMLIDHSNWTKFWKSSDKSDSLIYIYCNTWKIPCPFEMIQIRSSHLSLIYSYCGRFQITFYPLAIIWCYPELHLRPGQSQSRSPTEIQAGLGSEASFHPHSEVSNTKGIFRLMQIFDPLSALVYFFRSNKGRLLSLFLNHYLTLDISFQINWFKSCENVC